MEYHDHKFNPLNWRAIKGYLYPRVTVASTDIQVSLPDQNTCTAHISPETMKSVKLRRLGAVNITFSFYLDALSVLRVYRNSTQLGSDYIGNDEGTYHTATWYTVTISSDISWGDTLSITLRNFMAGQTSYVKDFYISYTPQVYKGDYEVILN